jgi:hypothetical protein
MTAPQPDNQADVESLTVDERFELLSARYRRYLLYSLSYFTTPVALARVADKVTELANGEPADELPDERLEIYMQLYHTHLPRLVEAGVVQFNQTDDTVEFGPNASQLVPLLRRLVDEEFPGGDGRLFPEE